MLKIEGDPTDCSERLRKRLKSKQGQPTRDGFSLLTDFRNGVTHSTPFKYDLDIYDVVQTRTLTHRRLSSRI
ncbi:hypothetical protein [Mesorhizobium sp. NZP2077]|uniref:hypothetical protein n=1 Tax=Mesorhizobium sp. NZP2077 TaxID=2483404 RepID=UPI001556083C|nr:hypothetical protein [Mesorhizobium sp. NZP2077]QKC86942.1 hypothetical protein EB232_35700 [Mesorhizobium sp. NZP2077]QKD20646.1 hypothetical protein HGP13_37635 [Mesorhizobium sp. NZP2077]